MVGCGSRRNMQLLKGKNGRAADKPDKNGKGEADVGWQKDCTGPPTKSRS